MNVFDIEYTVTAIVQVLLLGVKIFAFVNCLLFSRESYAVAGKLTKPSWAAILGVGLVLHLLFLSSSLGGGGILGLAFTIAAFVYLADVRPALAGLRRR